MESYNQPAPPSGQGFNPAPAASRRGRIGLAAALVALLGFFGFLFLVTLALAAMVKVSGGSSNGEYLTERKISGSGKTRIARIDVAGVIVESDSYLLSRSVATAESVIEQLEAAGRDPTVEAVLLRVESPGGGVTASDRIHREVARLEKRKKVAVLMGDQATSGGYYVSVAADRIFAHPTTVTGSIGVIMTTLNIHDLAAQHGVKSVVIKSSERKDLLSPFKPPDQLEGDKLIYQKVVTHLYERFVQLVSEGRRLPIEKVRELADGSVYDAQAALQAGLVDAIGYEDDVLGWLKQQLKKDDVVLFEYVRPVGLLSRLFQEARGPSGAVTLNPEQIFPWWSLRSRPAYLFLPGL